jgi:hypothetical protein
VVATGAGADAQILFSTPSNGRGIYVDDSDSNKLKIYGGAGKGVAANEVTIDNDGKVGIGTTSPDCLLSVAAADGAVGGAIRYTATSVCTAYMSADPNGLCLATDTAGITFRTGVTGNDPTDTGSEVGRFTNAGTLFIGRTSDTDGAGLTLEGSGFIRSNRDGGTPMVVNRNTDDGTLVSLRQAGAEEGSISVSGTTVSFNGGHLSRWSQLPDGSKDESIVKGTVMSNLDDMCVWEKDGVVAENEQLNKMTVSDVEGDTNVAGVFVNWTMDEQYDVDDMNVAMTGDMIIRIANGVVVQKGDLLMSAGDGTAKPQGDDIVRSKTVAKVTSNHITCTYADGSYCVPCVLMAC